MVKNLVCGAIVACLLAVNVASAQDCGCAAPVSSCGCNACQPTCCDPCCCNPLGTALKNLGCGVKKGLCHIKGGIERILCPIRYNPCCNSCSTCSGGCNACGSGTSMMRYGSPVIEASPAWEGRTVPSPPTPPAVEESTSVVPAPARFQPSGNWKSAQGQKLAPVHSKLYYSKVLAEKNMAARVSHNAKSNYYYATPKSK
ncbi:MAG: hypothetical protein ACIALR_03255 [Blastopirellula sp. JB062]